MLNRLIEYKSYFQIIIYQFSYLPLLYLSFIRQDKYSTFYDSYDDQFFVFAAYSITFIAVGYIFLVVKRNELITVSVKKLLLFLLPLYLLLFVSTPFLSADYLAYLIPAKNLAVFGQDPYVTSISGFTENPWHHYAAGIWRGPSVYAPLFNFFMVFLFLMPGFNFYFHILFYKFVILFAFVGCGLLLHRLLILNGVKTADENLKLYLLNPGLLISYLLDGHNDIFVLFLFLFCIYFLALKKELLSVVFFILSVGVKYTTVFLLPIFLFSKNRISRLLVYGLICSAVTIYVSHLFFPGYFISLKSGFLIHYVSYCIYACTPLVSFLRFFIQEPYRGYIVYTLFGILYVVAVFKYLYLEYLPLLFSFWVFFGLYFIVLTWITPWAFTYLIFFSLAYMQRPRYVVFVLVFTLYSLFHYFGL